MLTQLGSVTCTRPEALDSGVLNIINEARVLNMYGVERLHKNKNKLAECTMVDA